MTSGMSIELNWLPPFRGTEEVARTSAAIQIRFGGENATRFEDVWSQSVQESAWVSAYPLALWLASSWWRIRWETLPPRIRLETEQIPANCDWRLSHEVPAAGYGFVWPQLAFVSDGESIRVTCRRSPDLSDEPVHYLSEFEATVAAQEFERAIDNFMDLVLRRLDALGQTGLHMVWRDVVAERADRDQSNARKIEARLGFDPDAAPPDIVETLLNLANEAGADAVNEIAPVCGGSDPSSALQEVLGMASFPGVPGRLAIPTQHSSNGGAPPWKRAAQLATSIRETLRLGAEPIDDRTLSELLQISPDDLNAKPSARAPIGLAVRSADCRALKLLFHKRNRAARRFEAARFIADYLSAGAGERWLPVTDAATARQKLQRAFAAEFLCPIESLRSYLGDEFLPEAFEDAAEHFGISEMAIKTHLANHHLIPRTLVDSDIVF